MAKALHILLVIETSGGGSGRHLIDLARALSSRGHKVTIVYSTLRAEPWFMAAVAEIKDVCRYREPMRRGLHPSDINAVRHIRGIILRDGPFDIVHGHSSKGGAISRIAAIDTGCRVVYTPHAFITMSDAFPAAKRFLYASIERLLAPLTDALICVSSAEYDYAVSLGISTRRLRMIPNGLRPSSNADRSSVRQELGMRPEHVAIGFVGRLATQKAVNRLIDAFAIAAEAQPLARLVIVGKGPEERALHDQAARLGVSDRIVWPGLVNGARMMRGFDVFALPSLYEAFPYVLIESAFAGLPIVATRVGGTDELVREGINGYVIDQGDIAGFAAALNVLVGDSAARDRFGNASFNIGGKFTLEAMVARTLKLYEDLVNENWPIVDRDAHSQ